MKKRVSWGNDHWCYTTTRHPLYGRTNLTPDSIAPSHCYMLHVTTEEGSALKKNSPSSKKTNDYKPNTCRHTTQIFVHHFYHHQLTTFYTYQHSKTLPPPLLTISVSAMLVSMRQKKTIYPRFQRLRSQWPQQGEKQAKRSVTIWYVSILLEITPYIRDEPRRFLTLQKIRFFSRPTAIFAVFWGCLSLQIPLLGR